MSRTKFVALFLAGAICASVAGSAWANVGVNFRRNTGQHPVAPVDSVGFVPQLNWNNTTGANFGGLPVIASPVAGSLVDHTGAIVPGLNMQYYANGTWSANNGDGLPGAGDADLMAGYLDDTGTFGMTRVDVTGVPYSHYDVIAYLGSDGNGRTGIVSVLNHAAVGFSTNSATFTGYVANALTPGTPPNAGNSNVVRFTGLSNPSFILTNMRGSNNVGLHGIQIVQMPGPAPAAPAAPPAFELGHWAFEGNVNDSSGFDNHGTAVGGAGFGAGRFGQAISLSGTGQYAQISSANANFAFLKPTQTLAVSAWVKSNELPANASNTGEIVSLGDHYGLRVQANAAGAQSGLHFFQDTNPTGNTWVGLNTNNTIASESLAHDQQWHHIVAQKTLTHLEVYVDGVLASGSLLTGSESIMPIVTPIDYAGLGTELLFGRHGNGGTGNDFAGLIDEVRIFEGNLTIAEINNLRNFNSLVPEPSSFVLGGLAGVFAVAGVVRRRRTSL